MIDLEAELFTEIADVLRAEFDGIFVSDEYVAQPPAFPAVSIVEADNTVHQATIDSGSMENHADVMYEVNVYSNKNKGKKAECRAIAGLLDEQFARMGFTRSFLNPTPNMNDARIYRITGRYRGVVSRDKTVYGR